MKTVSHHQVTGMTCEHCTKAVTAELKKISGIKKIKVDLVPEGISTVAVTSVAPIPEGAVSAAIEEAGYQLVGAA